MFNDPSKTCTVQDIKDVLDVHFAGFIFVSGDSLSNSLGRQHSLLSPLDCSTTGISP